MGLIEEYQKIPCDLSGALSKNRFRAEMLWGASKMFDLFDNEDFCVIFDYKCDIEVHFSNSMEFYQIKTHKVQSPYSFTTLAKQDKTGKSIIGKLFLLKNATNSSTPLKVAIVSNSYLKINNKTYSDFEELKFSSLSEKTQKAVCKAMEKEIPSDVDLTNISFIYTSMNLLDPDNDLRGKIVGSFEKIMGCEPLKPNALYRLIKDTVETKACYEMMSSDYNELVQNKGITKTDLQEMLNKHSSLTDTSIPNAKKFIEKHITAPSMIRQYKSSLVLITQIYSTSVELKNKEIVVAKYLTDNQDVLPDNEKETLDMLYTMFGDDFSIEYSESDKKVFLLIVLLKWEDGKYE